MLKRMVDQQLAEFKNSRDRKCLVVRGARQVGKTFSIENFGNDPGNFESFISMNLLKQPSLKEIFSGDLDVQTLIMNCSLFLPGAKFIPGKTLLLIDEIQECPEAITSLKFWAEDGRFKVIASGSMLGIDYKRPSSYPVGYVKYLDMFPLNFHEFLWAAGIQEDLIESLRSYFINRKEVPSAVHSRMMRWLQIYMAVGGMPEVVQIFFDSGSMKEADDKQRAILQDYRYDIAHYASADIKIKAEKCYFSLPDQLSKTNHKFQYSKVEKGGSARKFESSLDWIVNANLVNPCRNVSKVEYPLRSFSDDAMRLYPVDIGLLIGMFDFGLKTALITEEKSGAPMIEQAKGGLYEALISDMLVKNGHRNLFYYDNQSIGREIEFLIEGDTGIIPIEVKASNNRSRSLDKLLEDDKIALGYKLISGNLGVTGKKITLPLYMAMFI